MYTVVGANGEKLKGCKSLSSAKKLADKENGVVLENGKQVYPAITESHTTAETAEAPEATATPSIPELDSEAKEKALVDDVDDAESIKPVAPIKPTSTTQGDVSSEETGEETVAEPEASGDEEIVETEPRFTKAKSFQLSAWLPTFNVSNQFSPLPKILGNFHRILFSAPIAMEFAQSIIKPGSVFVGSKCLTLGCRHDQPVGQPLSLALRE